MLSKIIWFTGLSGAGKTTLSLILKKKLEKYNFKIKLVDGDKFRKKNKVKNKFTKLNIIENNLKIIKYVKNIHKKYDYTIISVISPLKKTRLKARKIFGKFYNEIYVKCSISKLVKRDTKGLYKLAKKNKMKNLIGFNSKINYEVTKYKKIIINTGLLNKQNSIKKILLKIRA